MHQQIISVAVLLAASAGGALANSEVPKVPKGVDPKGKFKYLILLTHQVSEKLTMNPWF